METTSIAYSDLSPSWCQEAPIMKPRREIGDLTAFSLDTWFCSMALQFDWNWHLDKIQLVVYSPAIK
jgi:hypothetical protein